MKAIEIVVYENLEHNEEYAYNIDEVKSVIITNNLGIDFTFQSHEIKSIKFNNTTPPTKP